MVVLNLIFGSLDLTEEDILLYFYFKHFIFPCSSFHNRVSFEEAIHRFKSEIYKFNMTIHKFRPTLHHQTETVIHTFKQKTRTCKF